MTKHHQVQGAANQQPKPILDVRVVSEALESFENALSCQSCGETASPLDENHQEETLAVHQSCGYFLCTKCILSRSQCPICETCIDHKQSEQSKSCILSARRVFSRSGLNERKSTTNKKKKRPRTVTCNEMEYGDPYRLLKTLKQYHQMLVQMNCNVNTDKNTSYNRTLQSCLKRHEDNTDHDELYNIKRPAAEQKELSMQSESPHADVNSLQGISESDNTQSYLPIQKRNRTGGRTIHFDDDYDGPSNTGRVGRRKRKRQKISTATEKKQNGVVASHPSGDPCQATDKSPIHPQSTSSSSPSPGDSVFDFHSQSSMPKGSPSLDTVSSEEEKQTDSTKKLTEEVSDDHRTHCSSRNVDGTRPQHESSSKSTDIPCVTPAQLLIKAKETHTSSDCKAETRHDNEDKSGVPKSASSTAQESISASHENFVTPASIVVDGNRGLPDPRRLLVDGINNKDVCRNTTDKETNVQQRQIATSKSIDNEKNPIPSDSAIKPNTSAAKLQGRQSRYDSMIGSATCRSTQSNIPPNTPASCIQMKSQVTPEEDREETHESNSAPQKDNIMESASNGLIEEKPGEEPVVPTNQHSVEAESYHTQNVENANERIDNKVKSWQDQSRSLGDERGESSQKIRQEKKENGKETLAFEHNQLNEMPEKDADFTRFEVPRDPFESRISETFAAKELPNTSNFDELLCSNPLGGESQESIVEAIPQQEVIKKLPDKTELLVHFEKGGPISQHNDADSMPGTSTFDKMLNLQLPNHQQSENQDKACKIESIITHGISGQGCEFSKGAESFSGGSINFDQQSTADFQAMMKSQSFQSQHSFKHESGVILANSYYTHSCQKQSSGSSQMPASNDFKRLLYSQMSESSQREDQINSYPREALPVEDLSNERLGNADLKKKSLGFAVAETPVWNGLVQSQLEGKHKNATVGSKIDSTIDLNVSPSSENCDNIVMDSVPNPIIMFSVLQEPELSCLRRLYQKRRCLIVKHESSRRVNKYSNQLQNTRATHFVTHATTIASSGPKHAEPNIVTQTLSMCDRTFPYLVALAGGIPIISADWMLKSEESSSWIANEAYRIWGDTQTSKNVYNLKDDSTNEYVWLKETDWWNSDYGPTQSALRFAEQVKNGKARPKLADFVVLIPDSSNTQNATDADVGHMQQCTKEYLSNKIHDQDSILDDHRLCSDAHSFSDLNAKQIESLCLILGAKALKTGCCDDWKNPGKDKRRIVLVPDGTHYLSFLRFAREDPSFDFHLNNDLNLLKCSGSQDVAVVVRSSWLVDSICANLVAPIQQYTVGVIASNSKIMK